MENLLLIVSGLLFSLVGISFIIAPNKIFDYFNGLLERNIKYFPIKDPRKLFIGKDFDWLYGTDRKAMKLRMTRFMGILSLLSGLFLIFYNILK